MHQSVLLEESLDLLVTRPDGLYVDCTFGRGGHSAAILERLDGNGRLVAIDKDPQAIEHAQQRFAGESRFSIRHGSFAELEQWVEPGSVTGILMDLGVSSPQLDDAARGFSFMQDGPLDMRMDNSKGVSAREWLMSAGEQEIAQVLKEYGEEKFARRIARAIVEARVEAEFDTTLRLADVVAQANPAWEKHKHPATRTFQAIRIFINRELSDLELALEASVPAMEQGGRLVVISFHSLEDRIVKRFMRQASKGLDLPRHIPVTADQQQGVLRLVGKAIKPGEGELIDNIRARSAVMRAAEKR